MPSEMKKLYTILASLILLAGNVSMAQNISVSGSVKDSSGEPLTGIAVMLQGRPGIGTVTDLEGKWSLAIPSSGNPVLTFSGIGYKEQTAEVGGRAVIDIVMAEDSEKLDESVVIGYGSMRRSDLTGAVTSVKVDDEKAATSSTLDQMLEGRAAGVQVLADGTSPDAGVTIRVRGIATFTGNSDPLYVVDGVIVNGSSQSITTMSVGSSSNAVESTNGLAGINTQDIASIEILKDASATAIYGSQGSNGVVLITTKSASRDLPVVRYNTGLTISRAGRRIDVLSFDEYVDYLDNYPSVTANEYLSYIYDNWQDKDNRVIKVTPMDWQDYITRTAIGQRHYVSISGKPKNTNYFMSLGYTHSEGVLKRTDSDNITASLNLQRQLSRVLTVRFKTNFGYTRSDLVTGAVSGGNVTARSSLLRSTLRSKPYMYKSPDAEDEDEVQTDADADLLYGPHRWLAGSTNVSERFRIIPSLTVDWKINSWVAFKSTFGGEVNSEERDKTKADKISVGNGNLAGIGAGRYTRFNFDNTLTGNRSWGGHKLTLTLGESMSRNTYRSESVSGWNLPQKNAGIHDINNALAEYSQIDAYTNTEASLMSFFARGIWNWRDRYVLTSTVRLDGSSKFEGRNKWGLFPSMAFAWRITQEPWFDWPVISNAKLRLGWGQVGNQAVSNYQTSKTYRTLMLGSHINGSGKEVVSYQSNISNPDLKWETSEQVNAGLDLSLWRGRLAITADVYRKDTWDLLQSKVTALSTSMGSMYVNDGVIRNKGLELSIDAVPLKRGSLEIGIGGNISFNRNTIVDVGATGDSGELFVDADKPARHVRYFYGSSLQSSGDTSPLNIFIEGKPMGLFYGYKTDGIVQSGETGLGFSEDDVREPGYIKYKDLNGNGYIDVGDRTVIGNPMPKFTYGFNLSVAYRGFTLSAAFVGAYKFDIFNMNNIQDWSTDYSKNVRKMAVTDAWSETNPSDKWPALGVVDYYFSDRYVEDGSYLRMSDLTLSWAVPVKKSAKLLHGLTLSLSGGNLLVIDNYTGYSPFSNSFGASVTRMGVDLNSAPYPVSCSFDAKFTF